MNDKQQLAAMGAQYHLTEEQAKGLAERMPKTGALQVIDDEPLCMAKRIEELEAQVRVMAELLREATPMISGYGISTHNEAYRDEDYAESERAFDLEGRIEVALTGKLPEPAMPEGWQLVPVEPAFEMLAADGCKEHHEGQECTFHKNRRRIWAAMLAAAPRLEPKP